MIRKRVVFGMLAGVIVVVMTGCKTDTPLDRYIAYLDRVISILENSKIGASNKGKEIIAYIDNNKADVEKVLKDLRKMSPKETEVIANKMRNKVDELLFRIDAAAKDSPRLAEDRELKEALKALKIKN